MEMTGLQIFKYLPGAKKTPEANCKKCGCPTCMAFAIKLAKKNINIEQCPFAEENFKIQYLQNIKQPQKTIEIQGLKVGGENVLFRHEKTFVNPPLLTVIVDCEQNNYQKLIDRICNFEIKIVNETVKVDLIVLKNFNGKRLNTTIPTISWEELNNKNLKIIKETSFKDTKDILINTRTKAILEKDEDSSNPICVYISDTDVFSVCTRASFYICKYANMIIFENFDELMFSTLLTLRQNIFTDPQKNLQVDSGLYKFNDPDENSIIFLTTNFALTFFAVANELENLDVPSYLIVIPAEGMSVLTAWSAEKFTAKIVAKTIENLGIKNKIKTRNIIIPGLLSYIKEELHQEVPDYNFIVGTHEASDICEFVKNLTINN
ncbi:hypothetical protein IJ579_08255 [bacterium]|nr:hypothetical protein [bacterium]